MEDGYMTLAEAVALALDQGGIGVMDNPSRFLARIADVMDPDGDEMRVLMLLRLCNDTLLEPYRKALNGGPEELRNAQVRAHDYLTGECLIEPGVASAIASGIAEGIARFRGMGPSSWEQVQPSAHVGGISRSEYEETLTVTPGQHGEGRPSIDISAAVVGPIVPLRYTGELLMPEPRVTLGDTVLVRGRDYMLDYRDNGGDPAREVEATVIAVGVGAYYGSASAKFWILPPERREPVRGQDVNVDLDITESEAREGVVKRVEYELPSNGERAACDVAVPAGASDGELVVVSSMGDRSTDGGDRGNLRVQLHVVADQGSGAKGGKSSKLTRRAALALMGGALGLAGIGALVASLSRGMGADDQGATVEATDGGETEAEDAADAVDEPVEEEPVEEEPAKEPEEAKDDASAPIIAISAGGLQTVGVRSNGETLSAGINRTLLWKDDVIAASVGLSHTVGLYSDGTVAATGFNEYGKCDVKNWSDIIAISAGGYHTIGLHSDGTIVAVGRNNFGQCDATVWSDIIAVSAGGDHTVGLHSDGTVVAVGQNADGQCDVLRWSDVVAISAGGDHSVGVLSDGTAIAVGRDFDGQCDVSGWSDLVAVSAGYAHTVGLRSDGTAVAVGSNSYGQCDVSEWSDLVAVSAGFSHTVGLRSDGKVLAVGDDRYDICDVADW